MFIRSKSIVQYTIISILSFVFFIFSSSLFAEDTSLTNSLPPFNPESQSSKDSSSNKLKDAGKVETTPSKPDSSTTEPSSLDKVSNPSVEEKSSTSPDNKAKEVQSKEPSKPSDTEEAQVKKLPPFTPDPVKTLVSFDLDLLGLSTFISLGSDSLVRAMSSGFSVFYKLQHLTNRSSLLLNLGYLAFTTYTKDNDVDYDLTSNYIFAGSSYKQKITNQFSISAGINLGISTLKKVYIGEGKQTKITFTPGLLTNFKYDFKYIANLSAGLKVGYNFGKLSFLQHSLYVGLNF